MDAATQGHARGGSSVTQHQTPTGAATPVLRIVAVPDYGSTLIDRSLPTGEIAFAILRRQFAVIRPAVDSLTASDDSTILHDLRVAIARARTAIHLYEPALPARAVKLRDELGALRTAIGPLRDLDVLKDTLTEGIAGIAIEERVAIESVLAMLERRRATERAAALRSLAGKRTERMIDSAAAMLSHSPPRKQAASASILASAPEMVERAWQRVRMIGDDAGRSSDPATLHELRLRCKRLRYAVEFLYDVYGQPARAYVRRVVGVQDVLGEHHDAVTGIETLQELAQKAGAAIAFASGRIAERHARGASKAIAQLPGAYSRLSSRRWRALRDAMDELRPQKQQKSSEAQSKTAEPAG